MRIIGYLFFLVIVVIGVTFAYLNAHSVIFNYYFGTKSLPLSLLLVFALGIGLLLGLIVMFLSWLKLKRSNRKIRKQLKNAEKELINLRNFPIDKGNLC